GKNEGEFAMIIRDEHQKQGLGTEFLTRLVNIGKEEKLDLISADILTENTIMRKVCEKVGFQVSRTKDYGVVKAQYYLNSDFEPETTEFIGSYNI
ncbi:MAG TPA: GNAT family N-acetyltransferase, partial [Allocoleopsis sp.]